MQYSGDCSIPSLIKRINHDEQHTNRHNPTTILVNRIFHLWLRCTYSCSLRPCVDHCWFANYSRTKDEN